MVEESLFKQYLQDPQEHFERPDNVVESDLLSFSQKQKILTAWRDEEKSLQTAASENMSGGETDDLSEVLEAIIKLEEMSD